MLDKYTQTYMTTSERHSKYTAFSFVVLTVGRTEQRSWLLFFFVPIMKWRLFIVAGQTNSVNQSTLAIQSQWHAAGPSQTPMQTVHTGEPSELSELMHVGFCDLITYGNTNILTMGHNIVTFNLFYSFNLLFDDDKSAACYNQTSSLKYFQWLAKVYTPWSWSDLPI